MGNKFKFLMYCLIAKTRMRRFATVNIYPIVPITFFLAIGNTYNNEKSFQEGLLFAINTQWPLLIFIFIVTFSMFLIFELFIYPKIIKNRTLPTE